MNDIENVKRRKSFAKLATYSLGIGSALQLLHADSNGAHASDSYDSHDTASHNNTSNSHDDHSEDSNTSKQDHEYISPDYVDSEKMFLPKSQMQLKKDSVALVLVNPQIDFLSPKGIGWSIYGASIKEHNTTQNILTLISTIKALQLPTFVSYCVWNDQDFKVMPKTPMKNFIKGTRLCYGKGSGLNANDISNSGASFLPELEPFILDGKSILTTPRKDFGLNGSDLVAKLRIQGIKQVILCGMDANTHIDSHMRDLLSQGFEVGIVRDASAGAKLPEGDGYLAALINFRFMANEIFFTREIIKRLQHM